MADTARRRDPYLRLVPGVERNIIGARWMFSPIDVYLHWGDGTNRETLHVNELKLHTFDGTGAFRVRVRTLGTLQLLGEATVVIRPVDYPEVTVAEDPDHPGLLAATAPVDLDDTGIVPGYRVFWAWPNQENFDDFWGTPSASVREQVDPGRHRVVVRDLGTLRDHETQHDVAEPDLGFSLTVDGRAVTLTVDRAAEGKQLAVDWGDRGLTELVAGATATHTFPSGVDTTYLVQLWYADGSDFVTQPVAIQGGSS